MVAVVGFSGAGKTRLIGGLIPKLKARGVSVAVIKRCPHGFQWGDGSRIKDSELFLQAGSEGVGLWGPERWALLLPSAVEPDVRRWAGRFFPAVDIMLLEGGKGLRGIPKIAVAAEGSAKLPSIPADELLAVVAERRPLQAVPCFSRRRIEELVEFLVQKVKGGGSVMELAINQTNIRMNAFVQDMVGNVILAMIRSLDDVPDAPEVITFTLQETTAVTLTVNGRAVGMNDFVQALVGRIIHGILSVLDDVPDSPETATFRLVL